MTETTKARGDDEPYDPENDPEHPDNHEAGCSCCECEDSRYRAKLEARWEATRDGE